jgi:hypothetical protein
MSEIMQAKLPRVSIIILNWNGLWSFLKVGEFLRIR